MAGDRDDALGGNLTTSRARVANLVFVHLARAILRGKIEPGEPLPAERDLAERFNVSRVLVREAVHKLKELGLVRVKQGGQTTVLDPAEASDPRIMSLELEIDGATPEVRRNLTEKLLLHCVMLLELARGRLSARDRESLHALAVELRNLPEARRAEHVVVWWTTLARGTRNAILQRETRYWLDAGLRAGALSSLSSIGDGTGEPLYEKLAARLRREEDAAATMLRAARRSLDR